MDGAGIPLPFVLDSRMVRKAAGLVWGGKAGGQRGLLGWGVSAGPGGSLMFLQEPGRAGRGSALDRPAPAPSPRGS